MIDINRPDVRIKLIRQECVLQLKMTESYFISIRLHEMRTDYTRINSFKSCYGATAHKTQGQTLNESVIDIKGTLKEGKPM